MIARPASPDGRREAHRDPEDGASGAPPGSRAAGDARASQGVIVNDVAVSAIAWA